MSFSLDLNANQINQTLNAGYSGLVIGGTGLVRLTGNQEIAGEKTFIDLARFSGNAYLPKVAEISPTGDATVDFGASNKRFRSGFFVNVSGFSGHFQNLKVDNLEATVTLNLNSATGSALTLGGQNNLQNLTVSGNETIGGNLTVTGSLGVTGNTIFGGTITSTGNKTFSGTLNQSGDLNIFGTENIRGNLNITGDTFASGDLMLQGDINITGNHSQTGAFFLNSNNTNIVITGSGPSHKFSVFAPIVFSGYFNHSGDFSSIGNFVHSGSFTNTGTFLNNGNAYINGDTYITGNQVVTGTIFSSKVSTTGISSSGTSVSPALTLQNNLTTSASGGAIEYNKYGFFATNEATGAPSRALINQIFSYIAPSNFYAASTTLNVTTPLLGDTGIYLNIGRYNIQYDVKFNSGVAPAISLGISGSASNITNRVGYLMSSPAAGSATVTRTGFAGMNAVNNILSSGANLISLGGNNFYSFNADVIITGLMKVRPVFRVGATTFITGLAFSMQVTQLATGTGVGLDGANGPWSNL